MTVELDNLKYDWLVMEAALEEISNRICRGEELLVEESNAVLRAAQTALNMRKWCP